MDPVAVPAAIYDRIQNAAKKHQVDPLKIAAVIWTESGFRDIDVVGDAGESFGPMQLHRRGAGSGRRIHALLDTATNIDIGTAYLKQWFDRFPDDLARAFTGYNWPARALASPEPSGYARAVLAHFQSLEEGGIERDPADAPPTPSLLELIDTVWGALERGARGRRRGERLESMAFGQAHLLKLKEALGLG